MNFSYNRDLAYTSHMKREIKKFQWLTPRSFLSGISLEIRNEEINFLIQIFLGMKNGGNEYTHNAVGVRWTRAFFQM